MHDGGVRAHHHAFIHPDPVDLAASRRFQHQLVLVRHRALSGQGVTDVAYRGMQFSWRRGHSAERACGVARHHNHHGGEEGEDEQGFFMQLHRYTLP
jgi:hypothetical protein